MSEFTIYSEGSGLIVRCLSIADDDLALNIHPGEAALPGHWPNDAFFVKAGEPKPLPASPGKWARFDLEAETWIDPRDAATRDAEDAALLAMIKVPALAEVNALAGAARQRWITDLPGQDLVYAAKRAEAVAWLASDPTPEDLNGFPWLLAEVGITAPSAGELAQLWLNLDALWQAEGAGIEAVRLSALTNIAAASSAADIYTALETARAAL